MRARDQFTLATKLRYLWPYWLPEDLPAENYYFINESDVQNRKLHVNACYLVKAAKFLRIQSDYLKVCVQRIPLNIKIKLLYS